jgi:citronellol/citronellal dehydrogenase
LSQRVALVTGASRGIGRQLCIDLAKQGYDVVCAARSHSDSPGRLPGTIEETAEQVEAAGRRALAVPLDVRDDRGQRSTTPPPAGGSVSTSTSTAPSTSSITSHPG